MQDSGETGLAVSLAVSREYLGAIVGKRPRPTTHPLFPLGNKIKGNL